MIRRHTISSLDLPDLVHYRTMKSRPYTNGDRYFIVEGEKLVARLLGSEFGIRSVLTAPGWLEKYRERIEARPVEIEVYVAPYDLVTSIVGFEMHQCIMALARVPEPVDLESAVRSLPTPHLVVALDGIVDAENMGGIVRNAAAFGVDLLLVGRNCCSPFLRRSARVSMGGIFDVPIHFTENLSVALRTLADTTILATYIDRGSARLGEFHFPDDICLVFGSEGVGISGDVLAVCENRIWIPMAGGFDSLNVATASGLFLYEATRHRRRQISPGDAGD